ncbi:hypothetical protein I3842_13G145700 [Carya illinoinensis]|uniref:ATP-dependent DNA helicase n=1 Tax=Carya illinoinensis TaxID=32201 RepID=A0A922AIY5_CARIL|nr:hypothetical protein I3842_13G145700 [Carya illinoinensis]
MIFVVLKKKNKQPTISCHEYYCFKLQIRQHNKSILLLSGRLLQQFVVDMYTKIETSRLNYFCSKQQEIRSEINAFKIGRQIILPSSFIGGSRDMRKRYMEAMILVQRFGKPDIFLTMTYCPDLIARIFKAKLEDLKNELFKREIFGKVAAYEILDKTKNVHLYKTVVKHMMHGSYGILNPTNICMKKNRICKNQYPKKFTSKITVGIDCFPLYKRSNDGTIGKVRGQNLDNRWVVPYNSHLLSKFNCHTNVEICSTIKGVKYLYKYIYKGHDRIENLNNILNSDLSTKSILTKFFLTNQIDQNARNLLYREFLEKFVWNQQYKIWTPRRKGNVIGRIVSANPIESERYYLRILLNHIRGAKSFEDLKTVNGIVVLTFREAANLHGQLNKDNSLEECLEEVCLYQMPNSLRRRFTTILVYYMIALAIASSGVVASILPRGRTTHSCFKIPLNKKKIVHAMLANKEILLNYCVLQN